MMSPIKVMVGPFGKDVEGWEGKCLAVHEDGTFSQVDVGVDEKGPAVKFTVPVTPYLP